MEELRGLLIRTELYEKCAIICENISFTNKYIKSKREFSEFILPLFPNREGATNLNTAFYFWAGILGEKVNNFSPPIQKQLKKAEFKSTKDTLENISPLIENVCLYILLLGILKYSLEGIGENKKIDFALQAVLTD